MAAYSNCNSWLDDEESTLSTVSQLDEQAIVLKYHPWIASLSMVLLVYYEAANSVTTGRKLSHEGLDLFSARPHSALYV